jgi:hypothetical protein
MRNPKNPSLESKRIIFFNQRLIFANVGFNTEPERTPGIGVIPYVRF